MLYEIINMSDPYTIECPNLEIAAVACVLLGQGQYGLTPVEQPEDGIDRGVPLMLFGNAQAWFQQQCGGDFSVVFARVLATQREALAACLDSVLIGKPDERSGVSKMLALLPEKAKQVEARDIWHDARRSSLNDIGRRAWEIAAKLRADDPVLPRAPQQVFGI